MKTVEQKLEDLYLKCIKAYAVYNKTKNQADKEEIFRLEKLYKELYNKLKK